MPCAACTYMPNAHWRRRGGKGQGEGVSPPGAKRRASAAKVCTSEARKIGGNPLCCARAEPSGKAWFPYSCASAHRIYRVGVAGGKGPQRWEAENALAVAAREEASSRG